MVFSDLRFLFLSSVLCTLYYRSVQSFLQALVKTSFLKGQYFQIRVFAAKFFQFNVEDFL